MSDLQGNITELKPSFTSTAMRPVDQGGDPLVGKGGHPSNVSQDCSCTAAYGLEW